MTQVKDFDTLNVRELLENGKKLLNREDYEQLDNLLFRLGREYFDSQKIVSADLLRHITTQLILGGYTNIDEKKIRISFTKQDDKYININIYLDKEIQEDYFVTCMYDIENYHFRGEYSRIGKRKYYTLEELYNKQF